MFGYYAAKLIRKIIGYPAMKQVTKHKTVKVDSFSVLADVKLGRYSYVGAYTSVLCADIGKFCSISNYCAIGGGSHTTDWVSTSPVFNSTPSILRRNFAKIPYDPFNRITIGSDVWIGEHCLIKGGVTISDGAVIGMGSVVTKDVGPYEIWAGNPARLIKKRFDDETIKSLLELQWWDWNDEKLERLGGKFNDVEAILAEGAK